MILNLNKTLKEVIQEWHLVTNNARWWISSFTSGITSHNALFLIVTGEESGGPNFE